MKSILALVIFCLPLACARLPYTVGGQDVAYAGKWPWQASLQMFGSHGCGAAIISNRWLATAAHCVGYPLSTYGVVLGLHDRVTEREGALQTFRVARIIQHPDWTEDGSQGFPNDIAVIQLSGEADLSGPYAKAVTMASEGTSFLGNSDCWITGWGKLGFLNGLPNILQEAHVDVYSKSTCTASYGDVIADYHICVGKKNTSGACSGDSGGPLVCKVGAEYQLAGVTSFGLATCSTSYPSVYSRISHFRSWISQMSGV